MSLYSSIVDKVRQQIFELDYSGFVQKQKSITKLFPTFYDRVKAINNNGGIGLVNQFPEVWKFKVASGTKQGTSYDVYLRFKNIPQILAKFVTNKKLWKPGKNEINYNLLAPEVFNVVDMEWDCSCPADTFWGPEYLKTQRTAQFGKQEFRAPNVRNPKQFGLICKHQQNVLSRLPFYTSTFASFLKSFYSEEIQKIINNVVNKEEELEAKEVEAGA